MSDILKKSLSMFWLALFLQTFSLCISISSTVLCANVSKLKGQMGEGLYLGGGEGAYNWNIFFVSGQMGI